MVEFPNELDYRRLVFGGIKVTVVKTAESSIDDFAYVWDVLNGQHQHIQIAPQPPPKDPNDPDECDTDDGEAIGLLACIDGFNCPLAAMVCTNDIMVGKGQKAHRLKPQIPWLLEDVWKFKRLKDVPSVALDYVKEDDLHVTSDDASNDGQDGLEAPQRLYYFENCFAALVIHTEPVATLQEMLDVTVRYGTLLKRKHPLLLALHFIIAANEGLSMLGPLDVVKQNSWLMYSELYKCFYINVAKENWCDHLLVNVNHSELVCVYDPNERSMEKLLEPLIHNMIGILLRQWLDYLHETIEPCLPDLIIVAHGTATSQPSSNVRRRVARLIKAITRADLYMLIGNFYSAAKHYYSASAQAEGYGEYLYKGAADFGAALAVLAMKLDNSNWDKLSDLQLLQQQGLLGSQTSEHLDDSPIACASSNASDSAADDEVFTNAELQDISADLVNDTSQLRGRKFTTTQQQVAISLQKAFYAWIRCEHDPRSRLGVLCMFMIDWFWQQGMDRLAHYYIGKSVALMDTNDTGKFIDAAIARTSKGRFKRKLHLYRFTSLLHGSAIEAELTDVTNDRDAVVVVDGGSSGREKKVDDSSDMSWMELVDHVLDPSRMYADLRPTVPKWWTIRDAWFKANLRQCDLAHFPVLALEWFANLMNNLTCDTTPQSIQSGISQYRRMLEIRGFQLPVLTYVVVPIASIDTLSKLRNQCLAFKSWPTAQCLYIGGHYDVDIRPMVLCKLIPNPDCPEDDAEGLGGDEKNGNMERAEYAKLQDDTIKASLTKRAAWRHARRRIFKLKRTTGHMGTCRCTFGAKKTAVGSRCSICRSPRLAQARVYTPIVRNHSCVLVPVPHWFLDSKGSSSSSSASDEGVPPTVLSPDEASCNAGDLPFDKLKKNGGHHVHVYVDKPRELRLELANLLPVDVILENVQVLVTSSSSTKPSDTTSALALNSKSIMVPANSTNHCEIVEMVAKERGIYKVYGISFEIFKFKCIQAFLSNASLDIERYPWLIVEALENVPSPSVDVFMANGSFGDSRLQSMATSSPYHTIDTRQLTLPSISTSSLNPLLSERYEYWNGIRMPTFEDATLPKRVNSCADADCITCSSLHNIVLTDQGNWDKLIEGERKLLYIVLANTRRDGVIFKSLDLSIKSLEQKPLMLAAASSSSHLHGLLGADKEYHVKRSKIMTKAQQLNYTQCIKLLLKNAVYTTRTPRSGSRAGGANNKDNPGEYILGTHVHARGPLALAPGDELLIPMVYKANCKSRKFQIHLQAVIDTTTPTHGQKRVTYATKMLEFQVLPAIKVSKTRLDFFSNLDYSHEDVLNYIKSSNLYSHDLEQLLAPLESNGRRRRPERRHVFDSGCFSLALYLVNCTDYNFICHCRLADNSHLVASMGSESLWCLKVPKIGYMHARGMKPMSFLQHLESRLGLEWTCFPNKSGEIAISTIADAGNNNNDNTSPDSRQKTSTATKSPGKRRRTIDKYKSGLSAFYTRNQIWRLHGLEELANAYYLYSRVPRNLHVKLQHVIESLVTIRVIVTSINNVAKSTTFRQLPCGSIECFTTRLHEPFKVMILARVNGACTIANYRVVIIPYIFGTFAPPNGLVYKGPLELQPSVPLGPSCIASSATHSRIVHRCTTSTNFNQNGLGNLDFSSIGELQASAHKARVYAINVAIATPSTCFWHHKQILVAAE